MLKKKLKRNPANGRYTAPRAEASTSGVERRQLEMEPSTSVGDGNVLDCERVKRQAKQLLEIRKRNIQERIIDLNDQIEQVRKGVHPEYLKLLTLEESHRSHDDREISTKEAGKRAQHLKDELTSELEGMKRIIQRDVSWLTDDMPGKIANTLEEYPTLKKLKDSDEENYNAIQNLMVEDLLDPNICKTRRSSRKLEEHSFSTSKNIRVAKPAGSYTKAAPKVNLKDKNAKQSSVFSTDDQLPSVSIKPKKTARVKSTNKSPRISDFKLGQTDESNKFLYTDEVGPSQPKIVIEDAYAKNHTSSVRVQKTEEPGTILSIKEPTASRHPRKTIPVKYKAASFNNKKIESDDSSDEEIFPTLKKIKSEEAKFPNFDDRATVMSSNKTDQAKNIIFPDELLTSGPKLKTSPQPYDKATYLFSKKIEKPEEPKSFPYGENFMPSIPKKSIKTTPSCSNDRIGNISGKKMETGESRNVSFNDEATPSFSKKTRIPPVRSCGKKAEKVDEVKLAQMRYADAANYIQADLDLIKSQPLVINEVRHFLRPSLTKVVPMGYDSEDSDELLKSSMSKKRSRFQRLEERSTSESKQATATSERNHNEVAGSIHPKPEASEQTDGFSFDEQLQSPYKSPKKPVKRCHKKLRMFKLDKTEYSNKFLFTKEVMPSQPSMVTEHEHAKNNTSSLKVEKTEKRNRLLSGKKPAASRHPRKSIPVKFKAGNFNNRKIESDNSSDEVIFPLSKIRMEYEAVKLSSLCDTTSVMTSERTEQTKNIIFPDELLAKKALKTSPQPYDKATYISSEKIEEPKSFPGYEDPMPPLPPKKRVTTAPSCSFDRIGNFSGFKSEAKGVSFQDEPKKKRIPPVRKCGKKAEKVDEVKLSQMRYADATNYIQEDLDLIKSCDATKMKPGDNL